MDDEAEIRLVEAHTERDRRDERLDPVRPETLFEVAPDLGIQPAVVRSDLETARSEPGGNALAVGDGQAVDDSRPWKPRKVFSQPGQALRLIVEGDRLQAEAFARERPTNR